MGAHAFAPAVPAVAPDAVMLADARAPAVLAVAPLAAMLADARAPAVLAFAPAAVMLADARAPAVLAPVLAAAVLALVVHPFGWASPWPLPPPLVLLRAPCLSRPALPQSLKIPKPTRIGTPVGIL